MRGHWQTGGLRKLNRHYQSAGGGGGAGVPWDYTKGCIRKMTSGGEAFFPAPSYCWVRNGAMVLDLPYEGHTFSQLITDVECAKIENIELVPYIPKTSDNYYTLGVDDVYFTADGDTEIYIDGDVYGSENPRKDVILSFSDGENLNSKQANFIKGKYVAYILRKDGYTRFLETEDIVNEIERLEGVARIKGRPEYGGAWNNGTRNMFTGKFTAANDPTASTQLLVSLGMTANQGYRSASANTQTFRYPASTILEQYQMNRYWNGEQKVESISVAAINPTIIGSVSIAGSQNTHSSSYEVSHFWDPNTNKTYSYLFILKELEGVTCSVTG